MGPDTKFNAGKGSTPMDDLLSEYLTEAPPEVKAAAKEGGSVKNQTIRVNVDTLEHLTTATPGAGAAKLALGTS